MTTATVTLPPVTPSFQAAVRALGCQLGWKNVAKMIAYGPTVESTRGLEATPRRNGRNKEYTLAWYDERGRLEIETYHGDRQGTAWGHACERAHELDASRFQRPIPAPFTPARLLGEHPLDQTDARLALYESQECCGQRMGIMESWVHGEVRQYGGSPKVSIDAVYQCAVNPKHTKPAIPKAASAAGK